MKEKRKWVTVLLVIFACTALMSATAPFVIIDLLGIHYEPTSMGVADIATFLYSVDINRVFGSLNLLPLAENAKVTLPLVGEIAMDKLLMMFGDGTLSSLTGQIAVLPPDTVGLMTAQYALDAVFLGVIICLLLPFASKGRWLRVLLAALMTSGAVAARIFVDQTLNQVDLFSNDMLNHMLGLTRDNIHADGYGLYLFVAAMSLYVLVSLLDNLLPERKGVPHE